MNLEEIKNYQNVLLAVLDKSAYVSHKYSSDVLLDIEKHFPSNINDKLRIYFNPFKLFPFLKLKKLVAEFETHRQQHNESFIELEMQNKASFFDNAAAFPLDAQQRRAVIADEDNNLVIAGAGSGKTMTIVAKIKYLIEFLDVSADMILPISFTRKSAEEMEGRINIKGIAPQTFHKFGLTVLQSVEHRKPNIFDDTKSGELFRTFMKELSKDADYLTILNDFLINYVKVPKSQFEFESLGDYIQYMKDQNFSTYKRMKLKHLFKGKETFKNETVKSIEECIIANFLIFNRVEYEYEKQYEFPYAQFGRKKNYKPDFTIASPNGSVYLEHLGMDRDGNVPAFFAGINESHYEATRRYRQLLEWKKRVHSQNSTTLIESYSYEFYEGNLLSKLAESLRNAGVKLDPMTPDEIWEVIQDAGKDQVDGFIELCKTSLALLKSNGYSVDDARKFNDDSGQDKFMKTRASLFIDLFEPFFNMYEANLRDTGEIDFNDMITKATEYIDEGDFHIPLSYVIVDEFQDLSIGRYRILNAIRVQNPDVKFYCVGDDWQSIYRFAGSDITLFSDFEKHFGYTYTSKIETTYRFNDPLITLSSEFILKNPHQLGKSLRAPQGKAQTGYTVSESDSPDDDDTDAIISAIDGLMKQGLKPDDSVYVIGRYNFDIQRIKNRNRAFTVSFSNGLIKYVIPDGTYKGKTLEMHFITAHKAKGLEADYAILINCNSGKYGFPSGKADDPILNLLLSSSDQFENGEERRLFYVAMTRTKKHVVFITNKYRKSKFIREIQDETEDNTLRCPRCGNGELVKRSGVGYLFYGCTNWAYGCTYSTSKPPVLETIESNPSEVVVSPQVYVERAEEEVQQKVYSPKNITKPSKLSSSQSNKLEYFCKTPKLYAGSEKARAKVEYLISISGSFNDEELKEFNKALAVWKAV